VVGLVRASILGGLSGVLAMGVLHGCHSFEGTDQPANDAGGGGSADGGGGTVPDAGPVGPPNVIAEGQSAPWQIAVDEANVYFTNNSLNGSVVGVPKAGGTPVFLVEGQDHADGIALGGTTVYWAAGGAVRSAPKNNGTSAFSTVHAEGLPTNVIITGSTITWMDTGDTSGGGIESCPLPSCPNIPAPRVMAFQKNMAGLVGLGQSIFWTAGKADGYLGTCPPCASNNQWPVVARLPFPQGLALDGSYVFVALGGPSGSVVVASTSGTVDAGPPLLTLASGQNNPFAVVSDPRHVYFTTRGTLGKTDGTVMRVDKDASHLTTLAQGLANPGWLAIDDSFVYWTNFDDGTVMRISKE
jgi:hypothetical protein